ncbi:hypothetical protein THAOC_34991 [Thalassiosira oceanica]|uniref:Uncharacterized protein n=1 Tax=Thalassiosira oceanica TaxID=159749 RepID=K0R1L5_THAOC|nr:hypothetical protein THAOC_34991 [Thalassiosira oceanica]|eukprot:EJK46343.1 hypothetical protein THAOC_34991 [Thalassiosira oceanica]
MTTESLPKIVFGSCDNSRANGNAVTCARQKEQTPPTVKSESAPLASTVRSELAPSQSFGPPAVALSLEVARSQELNLPTTAPPGLGGPTATAKSPTSHHVLDIENAFVQLPLFPLLPPLLSAQALPFSLSPRRAPQELLPSVDDFDGKRCSVASAVASYAKVATTASTSHGVLDTRPKPSKVVLKRRSPLYARRRND